MTGVMLRLSQRVHDLSPSESKVAKHILEQPEGVVGLSVEELASQSGSSKAAVMRLCKSLGCKGYRDFSIGLATELAVNHSNGSADGYTDINVGDTVETIARNVTARNGKALENSLSLVEPEALQLAAGWLYNAQRIDFYGVGESAIVAMDAQYKFMRINKNCTAYGDPHIQLTSAANLGEKGVAVAISWSGETKEVVETAQMARQSGAKVISLTRFGQTSLAKNSDICFGLSAPEVAIRCGAMSSRIAQMNMVDIIFSCVVSQNYHEVKDYLERTRLELKKKRS
ncbi:MurR/RpiR family transcriptional regulator [Acutalibacter caecimuris]|uniref:MurR/RpiR family transcriptional regulator n=1 Tax=Acutalibacter caecimuris TaxID=3093657 RepID=UPI002AC92252|nr:MurR/RpiR family transcriptional regulator [Acutalibacter sp. M00118]